MAFILIFHIAMSYKPYTTLLLYECWWAQAFWEHMPFECRFLDYTFQDAGDWLWHCVFNYDKLETSMILQGARTIWLNRNTVLFGAKGQSPYMAARYVSQQVMSLQSGEQKLVVTDLSEGVRWSKPREGEVKINIDGAWDSASKRAGVGIICRNEEGLVCFVEAHPVIEVKNCLEVELSALASAMRIAEEDKLPKVIFETDNVQVMNGMMRGLSLGDQCWELLCWCRDKLEANKSWNMSLISREANECADVLAKKAKEENWIWSNQAAIPFCLSSALICLSR